MIIPCLSCVTVAAAVIVAVAVAGRVVVWELQDERRSEKFRTVLQTGRGPQDCEEK